MRTRPGFVLLRAGVVLAVALAGVLVPGAARPVAADPLFASATTAFTTNADPVVSKTFDIVGQVFLILGDSPAPLPNRTVVLERRTRAGEPWVAVARTTTTERTLPNGEKHIMFTFTRRAQRTAAFRVRHDVGEQSAAIGSSTSPAVSVRVHRQMPIRLLQPRPSQLFMAGTVRPLFARQRVVVLRKACPKCAWRTFATPLTDRQGRFKVRLSTPRQGSHTFKARARASQGFALSYSRQAMIRAG